VIQHAGPTHALKAREFKPLPLLTALVLAYFVACYALSLAQPRYAILSREDCGVSL
jgi:ABC-type amino acid transport system permease subunit